MGYNNARQEDVYRQLQSLVQSIRMDSYNLTRDEQDFLELKLDEFKRILDEKYNSGTFNQSSFSYWNLTLMRFKPF